MGTSTNNFNYWFSCWNIKIYKDYYRQNIWIIWWWIFSFKENCQITETSNSVIPTKLMSLVKLSTPQCSIQYFKSSRKFLTSSSRFTNFNYLPWFLQYEDDKKFKSFSEQDGKKTVGYSTEIFSYVIRFWEIDVSVFIIIELLMQRSDRLHSQPIMQLRTLDIISQTCSICRSANTRPA